jgi:hypothetical protein
MADDIGFIDNPHTPSIFVDDAVGFLIHEGTVRITLCVGKPEQPQPGRVNRVTVGQLVMSIPAAIRLAVGLHGFLENAGIDPSAAVRGDQTAQ